MMMVDTLIEGVTSATDTYDRNTLKDYLYKCLSNFDSGADISFNGDNMKIKMFIAFEI